MSYSVICPICQNILLFNIEIEEFPWLPCKKCENASAIRPAFQVGIKVDRDLGHIINYQVNICIDNVPYGFDSYQEYNDQQHEVTKIFVLNNTFQKLFEINSFTPIPKNSKFIEDYIKRILNLKAFL